MEKVRQIGLRKEAGYLYYVDLFGHVRRTVMARGHKGRKGETELVYPAGVRKEWGFMYFVDKDGDVSRSRCPYNPE